MGNMALLAQRYDAVDWTVALVLILIDGCVNLFAYPFCRSFEWTDPSINYTLSTGDEFPSYSLVLMVVFVPLFYYVFSRWGVGPLRRVLGEPLSLLSSNAASDVNVSGPSTGMVSGSGSGASGGASAGAEEPIKVRSLKCGTGPVYPWIKAHFFIVALELFMVDFMKLYAGRLRPDYLDRLRTVGYTATTEGLPSPHDDPKYYCELMHKYRILREGRLSFPSGHSSLSFSIFTLCTFYFFAHLRPTARQGSFARLALSLTPLFVPVFCAISRTRDNKHNFSDILAGSIIGVAVALAVIPCVFRQAGGPIAVTLARSERDVEYVKQLRIISTSSSNAYGASTAAGSVGDEEMTVAVPVRSSTLSTRPASPNNNASVPSFDGSGAGGGNWPAAPGQRVVAVITVTERELNEDEHAVPWL